MATRGPETPLTDVHATEASHASTSSNASATNGNGGGHANSNSNSSHSKDTSSSSSNKDSKLPLPDDFFQPPPLTGKERAYLVGLAKRACKEVVYYSRRDGGPMTWVPLASDDGIELCQGVDESAVTPTGLTGTTDTRSLIYLRGATKIYATIDEVADFFRLDTPAKRTGFLQTVGRDILDQRTLYTLATPTAANPKHFVAAKWTAVSSPSKLARPRDVCYLECHDEFVDTTATKRGWVRSVHSIRLPCCPRLDKSHGLVRASLYRSGFVFVESATEPNVVEAVHTLHMDVKGNSPNWIKVLAMKRRIKNIAQVNVYFQQARLAKSRLLGDLELPTKVGVTRCQVCASKFGLFHRKWRCRKCGKVICTPCSARFHVDLAAGAGPKRVHVCIACSDAVVHGAQLDTTGLIIGSDSITESGIGTINGIDTHAKRVQDTDVPPIYDPSSDDDDNDAAAEASQHRSVEEHEYYAEHEDARGLADMLACKRMQHAFESHVRRSSGMHKDGLAAPTATAVASAMAVASSSASQSASISSESMSGATFPADSPQWDPLDVDDDDLDDDLDDDDDELGLPRSRSEQQRERFDELLRRTKQQQTGKQQTDLQQRELVRAASQPATYEPQPHRSLGRMASQLQPSRDDDEQMRFRFANSSIVLDDHADYEVYQHYRYMAPSSDHLRKASLDAIRIASDCGADDYDCVGVAATDALSREHRALLAQHRQELQHAHQHHVGSYPSTTSSFLSATGGNAAAAAVARRSDSSSDGSRYSNDSSSFRHASLPPSRTASFTYNHRRHDHDYHMYDDAVVSDAHGQPLRHRSFVQHSTESARGSRDSRDRRYGSYDSSEYAQQQQQHRSSFIGPQRSDREVYDEPAVYRREPPRYSDVLANDARLDAPAYSASPLLSSQRHGARSSNRATADDVPVSLTYSPHISGMHRTSSGDSGGSNIEPLLLSRAASRADVRDRDELAHYMALSAMKLFEIEQGAAMRDVPDDVRQTALRKMMAVYASEIERSNSGGSSNSNSMDQRANIRSGSTPGPMPMRRSTSLEVRQRDLYDQHEQQQHHQQLLHRHARSSNDVVDGRRDNIDGYDYTTDAYERSRRGTRGTGRGPHVQLHSVQDRSDLASIGFDSFEDGALDTASTQIAVSHRHHQQQTHDKQKHDQMRVRERLATKSHHHHQTHTGMRRNDSFMGRPSPQQAAELRESVSSSRASSVVFSMPATADEQSRVSISSSRNSSRSSRNSSRDDRLSQLLQPESVYGDAESDTFSDLDFVDLPHLMRKDYVAPPSQPTATSSSDDGARVATSFTNVQQWQHAAAAASELPGTMDASRHALARDSIYHDGVERRLSELSPDDRLFRRERTDSGFASRSSRSSGGELAGCASLSMSLSSSSTRLSGGSNSTLASSRVPPQRQSETQTYAMAGNSTLSAPPSPQSHYERTVPAAARSNSSSSSYSSDEPDYVTEDELSALELPTVERAHMSHAELERYRASLAELMSDYALGGHRGSLAESNASSLSIGSAGFYSAPSDVLPQPQQRQPECEPEGAAPREYANKPIERRMQEMYL